MKHEREIGSMSSALKDEAVPAVDIGAWVMRCIFLAIGIAIMIGALSYGLRQDNGLVGPGLMPFVAALLTVCASAVEIVRAFVVARKPRLAEEHVNAIEDADALEESSRTTRQKNISVAVVFGVLLGVVLCAYLIGLLLSVTLMVFVLVFFVEKKPIWTALVSCVATFLFGYLVFSVALQVPLPTGILGLI